MALKDTKKDKENLTNQTTEVLSTPKLMTQDEYEKISRLKTREKINRAARLVGIATIILLCIVAIEPLFNLSFLGALKGKELWTATWKALASEEMGVYTALIIGDKYNTFWFPAFGATILFIAVVVLLVYILTFSLVDIVDFFKGLWGTVTKLKKDLSLSVKESVDKINTENKMKKKSNTEKDGSSEKIVAEKVDKEKSQRGRKKKSSEETDELNGFSEEQLDAMLRGEVIPTEEQTAVKQQAEANGEKSLF